MLKKYDKEAIEKAFELYENIVQAENTDKSEESSDFLKFFGILSISSLTTLGLNYLIVKYYLNSKDINRNKKNDVFFKNTDDKFREEFKKAAEESKVEIKTQVK